MNKNNHFSDELIQMVYASIPSGGISNDTLNEILNEARSFNHAYDVTGVLLYTETCFVQCLEGAWDVLEGLYARIERDPRHRDVRLLHCAPLDKRSYSDWDMGCSKVTEVDMVRLQRATWHVDRLIAEPEHESPGSIIMQSIWQTYRSLDELA